MRALAEDSQVSTALSYYATDATTLNSQGKMIWATTTDDKYAEVADMVNALFDRWKIQEYARDHILELATVGNLYIPTTNMYRVDTLYRRPDAGLDSNGISDVNFDIVPSTKIPPEDIIHLWFQGQPVGYIYKPEDLTTECTRFSEESIIHFSLGGLVGDYNIIVRDNKGQDIQYDIQFATPLMKRALQPTQTLNLLEDSLLLSSFLRVIKFINVECGNAEEDEIRAILQDIKDSIEQQLSIDTNIGDAQSYVNPQSPNNLIYIPRVNGQDAISVTELNMEDTNEQDSKLLQYMQDKKLSVLGVPKEALNFSSNEGLGNGGNVMSQRSAIYANALQRLENAYISGWTEAINTYFKVRGLSGFIGKFQLHMNPILTERSNVQFEKRDAALSQAQALIDLLKSLNVTEGKHYLSAIQEILIDAFPELGSELTSWKVDVQPDEGGSMDDF